MAKWSFLILFIILWGCGSKYTVNQQHPLLATAGAKGLATVYLIRPMTRYSGVADRPLDIHLGKNSLVVLPKGFYTQVKIKPSEATLTVKSYMHSGKDKAISQTSEKRQFSFEAGKTYYIYLEPYYRGYNWGTSFKPKGIKIQQAKDLVKRLKPIGDATKQPI